MITAKSLETPCILLHFRVNTSLEGETTFSAKTLPKQEITYSLALFNSFTYTTVLEPKPS